MRQFACKVRLAGSLYNEVPKSDVTVPEINILRVIHGGEAVVDITEVAPVKRSDAEERDRLANIYGGAIKNRQEIIGGLPALIGFSGTPLATETVGLPVAAKQTSAKAGGKPKKGAEPDPADEDEIVVEEPDEAIVDDPEE